MDNINNNLNNKVIFGIICKDHSFLINNIIPKLLDGIKSLNLKDLQNDYRANYYLQYIIIKNILINDKIDDIPNKIYEIIFEHKDTEYKLQDKKTIINNYNEMLQTSIKNNNILIIDDFKIFNDIMNGKYNSNNIIFILSDKYLSDYMNDYEYENEERKKNNITRIDLNNISNEKNVKNIYKICDKIDINDNDSEINKNINKMIELERSYSSYYNQILNNLNQDRKINLEFVNSFNKLLNKFINLRNFINNKNNKLNIKECCNYDKDIKEIKDDINKIINLINENENEERKIGYNKRNKRIKYLTDKLLKVKFNKLKDNYNKNLLFKMWFYEYTIVEKEFKNRNEDINEFESKKDFIKYISEDLLNINNTEFKNFYYKLRSHYKLIDDSYYNKFQYMVDPIQYPLDYFNSHCEFDNRYKNSIDNNVTSELTNYTKYFNDETLCNNFFEINEKEFEESFAEIFHPYLLMNYNKELDFNNQIFYDVYNFGF